MKDPTVVASLLAQGTEAAGSTRAEFASLIKTEIVRWGDVIKKAGITI